MVSVENESDLDTFKDIFGDLWSSATVRLSVVKVEDARIPNGEIIFHRESRPEETKVPYSIEGFKIYEETVSNPFDVVRGLFHDELQVNGTPIEFEFTHFDGNTSTFFQTGVDESRVFDDRPRSEVNTVFKSELSGELEDRYQNAVNEIDEQIKTANEPFFDLAKCEYYYFDYHFKGKSNADPMVLVFADPEIRFEVDDENELELQFPADLADKTTIIAYPQRPYGERKGWKIPMGEQEFASTSDGLATYTGHLELGELQEVYFSVYVGDKMMKHEQHYNPEIETDNDRFRIYEKYDQRRDLSKYLRGEDPNQFEVAVLNLLSIAGYIVQWFGEDSFSIPNYSRETKEPKYKEIDIIAHAPDDSHIAFVECTNQQISEKTSLLDRMENITSDITGQEKIQFGPEPQWAKSTVPCIATPQSPEQLSPQVVENLESMGIVIMDSETLVDIYQASAEQDDLVRVGGEPGFWWRQRL
jgi:hypothetical protein